MRSQLVMTLCLTTLLVSTLEGQEETSATSPATLKPAPTEGAFTWQYGPYTYDGAGNIAAIGDQYFLYDPNSRLVRASISRPDQGQRIEDTYGYDVYGNLNSRNGSSTGLATSLATNRLTTSSYDVAGNLTQWQAPATGYTYTYTYDPLNMLQEIRTNVAGLQPTVQIYTADDERLVTYDIQNLVLRWTVRDLNGKVLREYEDRTVQGGVWSLARDNVYRGDQLTVAITPSATQYFSLDHLGTPRVVTDGGRFRIGFHHYLPFGEEWLPAAGNEGSLLKFTGHERDSDPIPSQTNQLDYMHARHYNGRLGRFLSLDPEYGSVRVPGSLNRYAYAIDNPIRFIDPTGRSITVTAPRSDDQVWRDFWGDFFWFSGGVANAFGSDVFLGRGRLDLPSNEAYESGQIVGDAMAMGFGIYETFLAIEGFGGGTLLDFTGVGGAVGVPVQAVSAIVGAHGVTTGIIAQGHMMSGIKQRKEGKHGTFRGRDSKRANDAAVRRVSNELKLSKDQQQRLHKEISGRNLNYQEILTEAKSLFGK